MPQFCQYFLKGLAGNPDGMRVGQTVGEAMQDRCGRVRSVGGRSGALLAALSVLLAGVVLGGSPSSSVAQPVARDARLGGDHKRTRFVADLSKAVNFRVFTLPDPYRVIVDLPEVKFKLPGGLGARGRGLVRAYRYGLFSAGKSRIVIDVKRPVLVDKAFIIEPQNGQPARFVVDLVPTDRLTFLANLDRQITETRFARRRQDRAGRQARLRMPPKLLPQGRRSRSNTRPVIVIDPGHGGIDGGALSKSGAKEKDIVLAFSKALRDALQATGRYDVIMTRQVDVFVPLRERVKFARQHRGALMLSIHADSLPRRKKRRWGKVRGTTIYTLSERASDEEAKALAHKENRSDIIAGVELPPETSPVTDILIDLAQRETKNHSVSLANLLIRSMRKVTKLNLQPHRFADLRVLKAPDVPSVLVELGYLTNKHDVRSLKSEAWRKKVAQAMTTAINEYFTQRVVIGP